MSMFVDRQVLIIWLSPAVSQRPLGSLNQKPSIHLDRASGIYACLGPTKPPISVPVFPS